MELKQKTGRYLLYAIGEVVLVVVGILIALQINNWNEERKLEQERLVLIENLKRDFATTLGRLNEGIRTADELLDDLRRAEPNLGVEPSAPSGNPTPPPGEPPPIDPPTDLPPTDQE